MKSMCHLVEHHLQYRMPFEWFSAVKQVAIGVMGLVDGTPNMPGHIHHFGVEITNPIHL